MRTAIVVDDSQIELLMGKMLLESLDFSVRTADSGEEALNLLQSAPADLVVCDIAMPGMSGLELLDRARSLPHFPIFIMATGFDDAMHAVESLQAGAYGYLTKPLQQDMLRKVVDDAVVRRHKEIEARQQLENLSRRDSLTGLYNKDEFSRLLAEFLVSPRQEDRSGALLMVDVDGLAYINNTYGHLEGDRVLRHMAETIARAVRQNDCLARFEADTFAVYLKNISPENAMLKAQHLLQRIEREKIDIGGESLSLTAAAGCAAYPPTLCVDDLINNAAFALHQAKRQGRNCFHLYGNYDTEAKRELGIQLSSLEVVRRNLGERRFEMHYQPIVSLESGQVSHYEALIRLMGDDGSPLPPAEFIKSAETFGLIAELDRLVVEACLLKAAELGQNGDTGLAINLSGKSVGDAEMLKSIVAGLQKGDVDPARIIFEITETAAFGNLDQVKQFVSEIRKLGCRFALDDFGIGFSSFYYIKQLEFDYIKIDGSFVKNLPGSPNDQVFVRAMVDISRIFGMKIIAEWVENEEVVQHLKGLGVDYGQGYHFGRPAPLKLM